MSIPPRRHPLRPPLAPRVLVHYQRVLRAVSKNWAMLWQTAMLVVVVLFIFAAVGAAGFAEDFALGEAAEAVVPGTEGFGGCNNLREVRCCPRVCIYRAVFVCIRSL